MRRLALAAALLLALPVHASDLTTHQLAVMMSALDRSLRDPDSLQFRWVRENEKRKVICVSYRAKNGFGGYALGNIAVNAKDQVLTNAYSSFSQTWGEWGCDAPNQKDLTELVKSAQKQPKEGGTKSP